MRKYGSVNLLQKSIEFKQVSICLRNTKLQLVPALFRYGNETSSVINYIGYFQFWVFHYFPYFLITLNLWAESLLSEVGHTLKRI